MPRCEICESSDFSLITTKIREGEGRIMRCKSCGLIIQDLGWDKDNLREYYEKEYQETNSLITGRKQTPKEHFEDRLKTVGPIFENIQKLLRPYMNVLELGCGAGTLLSLINPHVAKSVGVELHTPFVEFIKHELGIEAHAKDLKSLKYEGKFNLAVCIDSLDHMPNPLETLWSLRALLAPGGIIYMEVPNQEDALNLYLPESTRQQYNIFFWHRAHLFYFTRQTLANLFGKVGFRVSITCRHNYTLKNYLNWYFLGRPQQSFVTGTTDLGFFSGQSEFERRMNDLFRRIEPEFKTILAETFHGDTLCCVAEVNDPESDSNAMRRK